MTSEVWRAIPGYEHNYQVSNHGRVRSLKRQKLLALVENQRGYIQCNLYKNGQVRCHLVHRLVALAFLGPIPLGYQVNHLSGVKDDNRVENLQIVTGQENRQHAYDRGFLKPKKGAANPGAKLSEADVLVIRRLRSEGLTAREIAKQFDVTDHTVYLIQHRKTWSHLD